MTGAETARYAWAALAAHRLRTMLSLLGMAIGVAAVVLLTALGEGAKRYVLGEFATLGSNLLIVVPGRSETTGSIPGLGGTPNDLTLADAEAIARHVPGVRHVAPVAMGTEYVAHRERRRQVAVMGSTEELLHARNLELARGRFLPPAETGRGASVAVLGHSLARELFPGQDPVGRVVRIGEWRLKVVGVMAPRGMQLGVDMDEIAILPVATAMRLFDRSSLFRILVAAGHHEDLDELQASIEGLLEERHDELDVTVLTQEAVLASFQRILTALTLAVGAIAAISLAVAGIGIMNVMLVSVSERTAEIGLMKALGAHRRQILAVFLVEAALLSLAGGLAGLAVGGVGVLVLLELFPAVPASAPAWAVTAAIATAVAVGLLFGVLPARRASRLEPVAALARK